MSKVKSGGLDQCGAEPFEQQQFGTAGIKCVKRHCFLRSFVPVCDSVSISGCFAKSMYTTLHVVCTSAACRALLKSGLIIIIIN